MSESAPENLTVESAIANLQQTADPSLRYYAAWWLGKFRVRDQDAIAVLTAALEDETDRSPDGGYPLRRNAARALGKLGDTSCVEALIVCLSCSDFYVREAAVQALGNLGDISCVPAILQLLDGGVATAVQVPGKPHLAQPYEAILEALGKLKVTQAITMIQEFCQHPVSKIKYAAARALYQLTEDDSYAQMLIQALKDDNLQLRRSILLDLGAIGYFPATDAIASAFTENSLKLIALKGILEHHLGNNPQEISLTPESHYIMQVMDQLL